jgi:hypothetical protein
LGSVHSIVRLVATHEFVDANGRSDIARRLGFPIFKRSAGGICDAIDSIEETLVIGNAAYMSISPLK